MAWPPESETISPSVRTIVTAELVPTKYAATGPRSTILTDPTKDPVALAPPALKNEGAVATPGATPGREPVCPVPVVGVDDDPLCRKMSGANTDNDDCENDDD